MSLVIELFNPYKGWVELPRLNPSDRMGSMANNTESGIREVYLFGCFPDDSKSIIYRSNRGLDVEVNNLRIVSADSTELEVIKELKRGEEPYSLEIRSSESPTPLKIRFSHI